MMEAEQMQEAVFEVKPNLFIHELTAAAGLIDGLGKINDDVTQVTRHSWRQGKIFFLGVVLWERKDIGDTLVADLLVELFDLVRTDDVNIDDRVFQSVSGEEVSGALPQHFAVNQEMRVNK